MLRIFDVGIKIDIKICYAMHDKIYAMSKLQNNAYQHNTFISHTQIPLAYSRLFSLH